MTIAEIDRSKIILSQEEKWIPGYEGYYSITKNGVVYSYVNKDKRIKSANQNKHRYCSTMMGRKERRYIHELLLTTFVGPRPEGQVARHLNDDPRDNRLENLCWGTQEENIQDAIRNGGPWWITKYSYPYKKICSVCNKEFFVNNEKDVRQKRVCSDECLLERRKQNGRHAGKSCIGRKLSPEHISKLTGRPKGSKNKQQLLGSKQSG